MTLSTYVLDRFQWSNVFKIEAWRVIHTRANVGGIQFKNEISIMACSRRKRIPPWPKNNIATVSMKFQHVVKQDTQVWMIINKLHSVAFQVVDRDVDLERGRNMEGSKESQFNFVLVWNSTLHTYWYSYKSPKVLEVDHSAFVYTCCHLYGRSALLDSQISF